MASLRPVILLATLLAAARAPAAEPGGGEYTLGVFPYLTATTLEDVFAPIAAELARAIGRPVRLATTSSYETFSQKVQAREYEIAYVQPFVYVASAAPAGYLPVAAGYEPIRAKVFVPEDSPIREARELRGRTLGLPSRQSAVAYLAPAMLRRAGLAPGRDVVLRHFSSHQSCLQQAQIHAVDACASGIEIVRVFERQNRILFRSVSESPPIPPSVFVVRGDLPAREREAIRAALVATDLAGVRGEARALFQRDGAQGERYFRDVTDREYDAVRAYLREAGGKP